MMLSEENINYIIKDIQFRGIVDEELGDELIDHICTMVEHRMSEGERFIEAYDQVIKQFGSQKSLIHLQSKSIQYSNNNTKIMIRNYFKIALRNLTKHKFYSAINIVGLAVGVACSLLIYLFVSHELSYDKFHADGENIYRLIRHGNINGNEFHHPVMPAPMAFSSVAEIPEIKQAVRFRNRGSYLVKTSDATESVKEGRLIFADSTVFDLFSFEVLEGDGKNALVRPNTIAISKSAADKYFTGQSALNKTLILDGDEEFEVTAVFQDMPENSHIQFDFLMSMSTIEREANNGLWLSNNFYTYVKASDGISHADLTEKLTIFYGDKVEPQLRQFIGADLEEFMASGNYVELELQKLEDVYLQSDFIFDIGKTGNQESVYLFIAIAIFILGLACINFMNLSTARSANRAKEVGVRKALGSYRIHLVRQFLTESVIMSLLAVALGFFLVVMVLPIFNQIAERTLTIPITNPVFIGSVIFGAIMIGIIAGIYPAFFLSAFKPINTLKGKLALGSGNSMLRSSLVVFQFFISILLIIGTIAIQKQLDYIQNKQLGFDKEQVIMINDPYMLGDARDAFKKEIEQLSTVTAASYSGFIPINGYNRNDNTYWKKGETPDESNTIGSQMWDVDADYLATMGMELVEGRNFDVDIASDSSAVIINEEAMKTYGFEGIDDAAIVTYDFDPTTGTVIPDRYITYHVIGVVKNFHFESLKESIGPLAMRLGRSTGVLSARVSSNDFASSIDQIEETWKKFGTGLPFSYHFLDDRFATMYEEESRLGLVFGIFSGLAIFIGCLGLFALATFMAEQRIKEIGIRKVLGASVNSIVLMLSKQFTVLVIIAFVIAAPVAWFGINTWLENYNYKITIGVELFVLAGILAFAISWLTVGYQAIRAATSNPVESLKSE